jgi:mono/diheme cytochrome c family protein
MRALVVSAAGMAALGVGLWLSAGPARAVAPSVEAGADLAARWCAGCHVVADNGAGTDAAPSFVSIAHKRNAEELKAFLAKPHAKPMRGFTLSSREIEDVVAYIVSLAPAATK